MRERGRLLKRERERERGEREREKDEESMRIGKERKVPEKQTCQNCMPTMNVNTLWSVCGEGNFVATPPNPLFWLLI